MKHFCFRKKQPSQSTSVALPGSAQDALDTPNDPAALFTRTRQSAIGYGDQLINALSTDLRQGERSELAAIWELLPFYVDVVATADAALKQGTAATPLVPTETVPTVPDYLISSWFLTECHNYLTSDPNGSERLHLATGLELIDGKRYTLDRMTKVALSRSSPIGAQADQNALKAALIAMDGFGHHLQGLFHSHPGSGAGATRPSGTDFATHERYENGGYPLIGAIFVKGYVRFFSTNHPFTITLYGKGVERVSGEKNVYKIQTSPRDVSFETITAADEG